MKIYFVLIYISHLIPQVLAEDWSPIYQSNDLKQLMQSDQKMYQDNNRARRCAFERREKLFPRYCFDHMDELFAQPLELDEFKKLQKEVNELCIISSKQVSDKELLYKMSEHRLTSEACRLSIKLRLEDIDYMNNDLSRNI